MTKRKISLLAISLMLLIVIIAMLHLRQDHWQRMRRPTLAGPGHWTEKSALAALDRQSFVLNEDFSSHLPLVILDTNAQEIPISTHWDLEQERFLPIEGVTPDVYGTLHLIDGKGQTNSLRDAPTQSSRMRIRRRGNSSMQYEKGQYNLKLLQPDSDKSHALPLLGMGEEAHWILNGSMVDKSLMRNYIVYELTAQFMPYVPNSRYCEVILYENGQYRYEGVYLLIESIRQGPNRVDINTYNPKNVYCDFIIRRDRDGKNDIMLDTYGTREGLSYDPGHEYDYGHLGLVYPRADELTAASQQYIEEKISTMEKVLYSQADGVPGSIENYIDMDSFVDLFLANEFFSNYDAGYHSTYFYSKKGGKISAGPVWDYDGAMDNYRLEPMSYEGMWFYLAPWFNQLVKHYPFDQRLKERYAQLRTGPLSDKTVEQLIDQTAQYIGPAQVRDWTRWAHIYLEKQRYTLEDYTDPNGDIVQRESQSYGEEIRKLKRTLREHGYHMDQDMVSFVKFSRDDSARFRPWQILGTVLSLLAFFSAIVIVRRAQ